MIWLLLRGELPAPGEAALLEAALVAVVDHGPQAPSIAAARMAATCGVGLNTAIATGVNVLGDVHGGAGQQCVELLNEICDAERGGADLDDRRRPGAGRLAGEVAVHSRFRSPLPPGRPAPRPAAVPGRRRGPGRGRGRPTTCARPSRVEAALNRAGRRPVPMNIDGATAVIYAELGFAAPLARGLFVLSRVVGILAHAWEETQQGRRNKGPIPPSILPAYLGQ